LHIVVACSLVLLWELETADGTSDMYGSFLHVVLKYKAAPDFVEMK